MAYNGQKTYYLRTRAAAVAGIKAAKKAGHPVRDGPRVITIKGGQKAYAVTIYKR